MGFYSPSTLVQDARRHGVEVRPVDVTVSEWNCTLEHQGYVQPAVRLGFAMVRGLSEYSAKRVTAARAENPIESVDDLARRTGLAPRDLRSMAAAGAFATLAGHRRNAHWLAAGNRPPGMLRNVPISERLPDLPAPSEGEDLVADYASLGLTLGRHPLALLRQQLQRMRLATAVELQQLSSGERARMAGIVTGRQKPQTAKGTMFVTLEDETGCVNVVVWNRLAEKQRRELLGSTLLGVEGVMEKQDGGCHLVARRFVDHSRLLGRLETDSRDFR
jgi:error-prone DNA polymerase